MVQYCIRQFQEMLRGFNQNKIDAQMNSYMTLENADQYVKHGEIFWSSDRIQSSHSEQSSCR